MPTPTKRPLKKGDPCWIRIQRKGKPVLAVYSKPSKWCPGCHFVRLGDDEVFCAFYRFEGYDEDEAIFVAKPTQGIE